MSIFLTLAFCLICQLFLHNIWLLDSHWQEKKMKINIPSTLCLHWIYFTIYTQSSVRIVFSIVDITEMHTTTSHSDAHVWQWNRIDQSMRKLTMSLTSGYQLKIKINASLLFFSSINQNKTCTASIIHISCWFPSLHFHSFPFYTKFQLTNRWFFFFYYFCTYHQWFSFAGNRVFFNHLSFFLRHFQLLF